MKRLFTTLLLFATFSSAFAQLKAPYKTEAVYKIDQNNLVVEAKINTPENIHIYASEKLFFKVETQIRENLGKVNLTMPATKDYKDPFSGKNVKIFADQEIRFVLTLALIDKKAPWKFAFSLQTQGCSEIACLPPVLERFSFPNRTKATQDILIRESEDKVIKLLRQFEITKVHVGAADAEQFISFLNDDAEDNNLFAGRGFLITILLIIGGGLLLNLTPCILPMIPINLAIIGAGKKTFSKWNGFRRGLYYGLGIAVAYGLLGLTSILSGAQFGTINSSSWFNFSVAIVFIILALAMLDILFIDFSKFKKTTVSSKARSGSFLGVFGLGVISALLAGACVAPVVIAVLLHSTSLYSQGQTYALILPFMLGFGMALPWPLAGAGLSVIPKPGAWMTKIKLIFSIFIFAMAIRYAWTGYKLLAPSTDNNQAYLATAEVTKLKTALAKGLSENRRVVVDFWASWCGACMHMKNTTFKDEAVIRTLSKDIFVEFQAEKLSDPQINKVLRNAEVKGLPTVLILTPKK